MNSVSSKKPGFIAAISSPAAITAISLFMLIGLCILDYATGDYSIIVFYLIPVSLAAWFISSTAGIVFCILTLGARIIADESAESFTFAYSVLHYWNQLIEFLFLVIMSILFSVLKKTLDSEMNLARRDHLTGILNRRSFFDLAEHEFNRSRRSNLPFTITYIDLDNFKVINDQFGHSAGDQVLTGIAAALRESIRSTDILARLGGDEFVILFPETSGASARDLLQNLHASLNSVAERNKWQIGFSIGAISYPNPPATVDEMVHQADELMYSVKHSGKNRLLHREHGGVSNG